MKFLGIISIFAIALVASQAWAGIINNLGVQLHHKRDYKLFRYLDERTSLRELANQCLKEWHYETNQKSVIIQNSLGFNYDLDKSLKEAGVKNGVILTLKLQHSYEDLIDNVKNSIHGGN